MHRRLHNFIITRNIGDASFQHVRCPGWRDQVKFGDPSDINGDPLGEALADERFQTEPVLSHDMPAGETSELGTSIRRSALLAQCASMQLQRPAVTIRRRASDAQRAL